MRYYCAALRALAIATAAVAVLAMASPATFAAQVHLAPGDVAATRAFMAAEYAFTRTFIANLPASRAAIRALGDRIGTECPGVLARAPWQSEDPHRGSGGARQRRERARESKQEGVLTRELLAALLASAYEPDRQASAIFDTNTAPLQWDNPRIARWVKLDSTSVQKAALDASLPVCADIAYWVDSGYTTLSSGTKEFRDRSKVAARKDDRGHTLLVSYERAVDRPLLLRQQRLARRATSLVRSLDATLLWLVRKLGIRIDFGE